MEAQRNKLRARHRICLWATLVLVSRVAHSDREWYGDNLFAEGVDDIAGGNRCAEHFPRDRRGMAAFGSYAHWISRSRLVRQEAQRQCVLRNRHGEFRGRGSNRKFRFANLRRRFAISDRGSRGRQGLRFLSEADTRQNGEEFRIQLWDLFL